MLHCGVQGTYSTACEAVVGRIPAKAGSCCCRVVRLCRQLGFLVLQRQLLLLLLD